MLPGLEPFTSLSVSMSLLALVVGVAVWTWLISTPTLKQRVIVQSHEIRQMLLKQMTIVIFVLVGLLLVGNLFAGTIIGGVFSLLSTLGGMVFWGYLGALVLHIVRSGKADS